MTKKARQDMDPSNIVVEGRKRQSVQGTSPSKSSQTTPTKEGKENQTGEVPKGSSGLTGSSSKRNKAAGRLSNPLLNQVFQREKKRKATDEEVKREEKKFKMAIVRQDKKKEKQSAQKPPIVKAKIAPTVKTFAKIQCENVCKETEWMKEFEEDVSDTEIETPDKRKFSKKERDSPGQNDKMKNLNVARLHLASLLKEAGIPPEKQGDLQQKLRDAQIGSNPLSKEKRKVDQLSKQLLAEFRKEEVIATSPKSRKSLPDRSHEAADKPASSQSVPKHPTSVNAADTPTNKSSDNELASGPKSGKRKRSSSGCGEVGGALEDANPNSPRTKRKGRSCTESNTNFAESASSSPAPSKTKGKTISGPNNPVAIPASPKTSSTKKKGRASPEPKKAVATESIRKSASPRKSTSPKVTSPTKGTTQTTSAKKSNSPKTTRQALSPQATVAKKRHRRL